jgi:hypothetical protein
MPAFTSILAGAALAASAGGTAYNIVKSNQAADDAKKQAEEQAAKQAQLEAEAKKRAADEESLAASTAARDQARSRQKRMASGAQGRQSTLLTGPLGITGAEGAGQAAGGKTLLGS